HRSCRDSRAPIVKVMGNCPAQIAVDLDTAKISLITCLAVFVVNAVAGARSSARQPPTPPHLAVHTADLPNRSCRRVAHCCRGSMTLPSCRLSAREGRPQHAVTGGLNKPIHRYGLRCDRFLAIVDGLEMDVRALSRQRDPCRSATAGIDRRACASAGV